MMRTDDPRESGLSGEEELPLKRKKLEPEAGSAGRGEESKYKCHSAAYLWPGELAAVEHDDFEG